MRCGYVFGTAWGGPGVAPASRAGPFWRPFFYQKSKKAAPRSPKGSPKLENERLNIHAKIDAEKDTKSMQKGIQYDAKMDAKITVFSRFFEKSENARDYSFYHRKRGSGHLEIQ